MARFSFGVVASRSGDDRHSYPEVLVPNVQQRSISSSGAGSRFSCPHVFSLFCTAASSADNSCSHLIAAGILLARCYAITRSSGCRSGFILRDSCRVDPGTARERVRPVRGASNAESGRPAIFTGGSFGIEGGLIALTVTVAAIAVLIALSAG